MRNSDKEKNHHCRIFKNVFLGLRKIYKRVFFCMGRPLSTLCTKPHQMKLAWVTWHGNKKEWVWMKKTFETQDFYISFLNCNQKSTVYSHLMNAAHTAEKMHCKILEKCLQLIQWFWTEFYFLWYSIFKNTNNSQAFFLLSSIIFWRAMRCAHYFPVFLLAESRQYISETSQISL